MLVPCSSTGAPAAAQLCALRLLAVLEAITAKRAGFSRVRHQHTAAAAAQQQRGTSAQVGSASSSGSCSSARAWRGAWGSAPAAPPRPPFAPADTQHGSTTVASASASPASAALKGPPLRAKALRAWAATPPPPHASELQAPNHQHHQHTAQMNILSSERQAAAQPGFMTGVSTAPGGQGFKKTFYKRRLPSPPSTAFASVEGRALRRGARFGRGCTRLLDHAHDLAPLPTRTGRQLFAEALTTGHMNGFFKLMEQFRCTAAGKGTAGRDVTAGTRRDRATAFCRVGQRHVCVPFFRAARKTTLRSAAWPAWPWCSTRWPSIRGARGRAPGAGSTSRYYWRPGIPRERCKRGQRERWVSPPGAAGSGGRDSGCCQHTATGCYRECQAVPRGRTGPLVSSRPAPLRFLSLPAVS